MAVKLVVIYPRPRDIQAFETIYNRNHVPMAVEKLAGKTKLVATRVLGSPNGKPSFHRIAEVHFPSMQALEECAASQGGKIADDGLEESVQPVDFTAGPEFWRITSPKSRSYSTGFFDSDPLLPIPPMSMAALSLNQKFICRAPISTSLGLYCLGATPRQSLNPPGGRCEIFPNNPFFLPASNSDRASSDLWRRHFPGAKYMSAQVTERRHPACDLRPVR